MGSAYSSDNQIFEQQDTTQEQINSNPQEEDEEYREFNQILTSLGIDRNQIGQAIQNNQQEIQNLSQQNQQQQVQIKEEERKILDRAKELDIILQQRYEEEKKSEDQNLVKSNIFGQNQNTSDQQQIQLLKQIYESSNGIPQSCSEFYLKQMYYCAGMFYYKQIPNNQFLKQNQLTKETFFNMATFQNLSKQLIQKYIEALQKENQYNQYKYQIQKIEQYLNSQTIQEMFEIISNLKSEQIPIELTICNNQQMKLNDLLNQLKIKISFYFQALQGLEKAQQFIILLVQKLEKLKKMDSIIIQSLLIVQINNYKRLNAVHICNQKQSLFLLFQQIYRNKKGQNFVKEPQSYVIVLDYRIIEDQNKIQLICLGQLKLYNKQIQLDLLYQLVIKVKVIEVMAQLIQLNQLFRCLMTLKVVEIIQYLALLNIVKMILIIYMLQYQIKLKN